MTVMEIHNQFTISNDAFLLTSISYMTSDFLVWQLSLLKDTHEF